mgnify:FL=1
MVVKLENIGAGDFQSRLATAASTVADGTVVDCTFYTGTQTINKTIVVSKSATFVFGNSIINGTLPANNHMFHIVVPNVRFQGDYEVGIQNLTATTSTNTSTKPKFVMTEKGSGYHFYCSHTAKTGTTYNWASASGFSLHNLELTGITSQYTLDSSGNPVYSIPGAGGVFITEGNPGISGSNIANVRLTDLTIDRTRFNGILLYGAIASTIANTSVNAATGHGIFISGSSTSVEIDTCKVTNSGFAGIIHQNSTYSSVRSCISEQNGLGYWLRSSNNITLEACGAEKGFVKPTAPSSFGIILYNSTGSITLSEVGGDHVNYIKGTSYFTSGGSYNTYESCYSKNPGNVTTSYLDKRTTHFGFLGTTEKCKVIAPGIFNSGVVKYNYRIESLGASAPSDLFINAPVSFYDPSNPTESPDNPTQQTATVLDQGTGNVFKIAVDKISFNSTDLEVVESDAEVIVNRKKINGMFVVPVYASEPALPAEWSGAMYFNTTNNTLYMRDDGVWYSTCCTPSTPYNPTPIVLPPYSVPIDLTPDGPSNPPTGGGSGSGGGTTGGSGSGTGGSTGTGGGSGGSSIGGGGLGGPFNGPGSSPCCNVVMATLSLYSVADTAYGNCLAGQQFFYSLSSAAPGDPQYEFLLENSFQVVYVAAPCNNAEGFTAAPELGTYFMDANTYDDTLGYYTGTIPDGYYTTWLSNYGGRWYQLSAGTAVATGWCSDGIGSGALITGDPGNTSITIPSIGSGSSSGSTTTPSGGWIPSAIPTTCIPVYSTSWPCNFPNGSINFICSSVFGMAVPYGPIICTSMVLVNYRIYYKFGIAAQSSVEYGTNYNNNVITGLGINTDAVIAFRRYNTLSATSEVLGMNYPISYYVGDFDISSIMVDEADENIYISRVVSPANITNTFTSVQYDQAPSIIKYNITSGICTGAIYEDGIGHTLDFSPVTIMRQNILGNRITYATLRANNNGVDSRYVGIIIRTSNLDYVEHHEFEIGLLYDYRPVDSEYYSITMYGGLGEQTYPTIAIDDSSYHLDENNLLLFVPTRDYTAPATKLVRRYMLLNYDDDSVSTIDISSLDPTEPSLGIKFYSDPTLDVVYAMDVLKGRVTALDPTNNYNIVDEWDLEDPVYDAETGCIFKSFAIRKTPSNKIICYYITTAINNIAPGSPPISLISDPAFYDTKVCATRLVEGGTTGTIYSGYVNAPYGYPGMAPRVKLAADDPTNSVYIVGNTVYKMCNLIDGE